MPDDAPPVKKKAGNPKWVKGQSACPDKVWKPGESGNPNKRQPNDPPITTLLRRMIEGRYVKKRKGRTFKERIVEGIMHGAIEGNSTSLRELLERLEGKVPQGVYVPEGREITLKVVYDKSKRRDDQ